MKIRFIFFSSGTSLSNSALTAATASAAVIFFVRFDMGARAEPRLGQHVCKHLGCIVISHVYPKWAGRAHRAEQCYTTKCLHTFFGPETTKTDRGGRRVGTDGSRLSGCYGGSKNYTVSQEHRPQNRVGSIRQLARSPTETTKTRPIFAAAFGLCPGAPGSGSGGFRTEPGRSRSTSGSRCPNPTTLAW